MSASIQVLKGSKAGQIFPLTKASNMVGRLPSNDIVLDDETVSRNHAQIVQDGTHWRIKNESVKKTITINQRTILKHLQEATICNSDIILLGEEIALCFHSDTPLQQSPGPSSVSDQSRYQRTHKIGIPYLAVSMKSFPEKREDLVKPILTLGRDPLNDIVIDDPVVSRYHAQIVKEGEQFVFIHPQPHKEDTANGLFYEGRWIRGNEQFRHPLASGDVFRIGNEDEGLVTLTYNDGKTDAQQLSLPKQEFPLGRPLLTIGRLPDSDIPLDHPLVSRKHAELRQISSGYRIVDMNSTNHVYVNGQQVKDSVLSVGDEIHIGPFILIYTGITLTQRDGSKGIRIEARNLRKYGNQQVVLLNDISLVIPRCSFVAIVGGSGAGKSTLLKALSGLQPADTGDVFYNDTNYYRQKAAFSTQIGYVPQDDIVHPDLTVEHALYYAARIRLPDDTSEQEIQKRIDGVLANMRLVDQRHQLVKEVSGGQRKRISIAMELLADPSVFFLDEPTSGLDPGLDLKMMILLRWLADKATIILVTHATNNISYCDYVCFLAEGGRLVYFGPPDDAKTFFSKKDFAEIYTSLDPQDQKQVVLKKEEERFRTSPEYQKYITGSLTSNVSTVGVGNSSTTAKAARRSNRWKQLSILTRRYIELLLNDRGNLIILLLQAPVIALILVFLLKPATFAASNIVQCPATAHILSSDGFPDIPGPHNPVISTDCNRVERFLTTTVEGKAFAAQNGGEQQALQAFISPGNGDAQKMLFIMAFAAIMFGCVNAAREIVKEISIYRRERMVNIGIAPYMFSKIIVLGGLCLLQNACLVTIVNLRAPLHQGIVLPIFAEVYITLVLTSLTGLMLGLTVSALVPNNDRAMSFIPLLLIPQVIFAGTLFPLNNWPLQIIGSIFPVRWAMAALGSSIGLHSDKLGGDTLFGNDPTYHGTLFSTYSQTEATYHLLFMWLALIVMILILGCAIAIFLKRKERTGK